MTFTSSPPIRWSLCALWAALSLLVFMALDASSLRSWIALIVTGMVPPVVFIGLWNEGPPPTIAEVLRATEDRR
jgi:hypothetical protein